MFKYRIRMFFNELKVLVFMRSGSRHSDTDVDLNRRSTMRGLGMGGCGWPPFVDCSSRNDEEEYYGSDPRPRSLAFEEKDPKLQAGLDAVSLASSTGSGMRTPQCRICFQGPEQVGYCPSFSSHTPHLIGPAGLHHCFRAKILLFSCHIHSCSF